MAKREQRGSVAIDLRGLRVDPLSIRELLEKGSAAEVREQLCSIGSVLLAGLPLSKAEADWLGHALVKISFGKEDANKALRVKERKNAAMPSLRSRRDLAFTLSDLARQGVKGERAFLLIADARLTRYDANGDPIRAKPEDVERYAERLNYIHEKSSRGN